MRKILLPPVLLITCLAGMLALKKLHIQTYMPFGDIAYAGYAFIITGFLLPIWGSHVFKQAQTNILPYNDPDSMVTGGPFKFSRNPMYLGMLFVLIGAALKIGAWENFAFVTLFFCVANWWYIPFEETRMYAVFGDAFVGYQAKVRRWL